MVLSVSSAWPKTAEKSEGVSTAHEFQHCTTTGEYLGTLREEEVVHHGLGK